MDDAARMASFDECFEHQAWVRTLAVRLCRDSGSADDLAQDAWVEVVRSTNAARSSRAWLGGVVRNLARRSHRRDEARHHREASAAREDVVPSADELLAQAELQRRVLSAVASLDEAHRVVVLMRYYEGCDSEEIARRLGVPSSTVRNRLARAQEKLRGKLDREYGDRAAWSVLFAPTLAWKSSAGAAAGIGVAMKVQLALAAAAIAAAAVFFWPRATANHVSQKTPDLEVAATAELSAPNIALADARSAVDSESNAVAATSSGIERVLVFGDMLGLGDIQQLERGKLSFVGERGVARDATFGVRNAYSIFGLKRGTYRITSWVRGFVPLDEELVVPPGTTKLRHDITLTKALALPVTFVERDSRAVIKASPASWRGSLGAVVTHEPPTRITGVLSRAAGSTGLSMWYPNTGTRQSLEDPNGPSGVLEIWEPAPLYVSCVLRDVVLESRPFRGDERELEFALDLAELEAKLASLALRCVDATTGAPIEGARVRASAIDGSGANASTDALGAARVANVVPGLLRVSIDADGYALLLRWQHFEPGAAVDLSTIELLPEARLHGRVIGENGEGVCARLTVSAPRGDAAMYDLDSPRYDESAEDGSFTLEGVAADRLRIVASDDDWAITALDVDATGGAVDGLELRLVRGIDVALKPPRGSRTAVEVAILDGAGRPLTSRAVHSIGGSHLRLAPGRYELQTMVDKQVVRQQAFEVGADPLVVEVAAP